MAGELGIQYASTFEPNRGEDVAAARGPEPLLPSYQKEDKDIRDM